MASYGVAGANRRVAHARLAELLDEALRHLEDAAVLGDVLAQEDDPVVPAHRAINLNPDLTQPVVLGFIHSQGHSSLGPVSATNIGFLTGDFTFVLPEWCTGTTVVFLPAIEASSGYIGLRFDATGELLQFKQVIE